MILCELHLGFRKITMVFCFLLFVFTPMGAQRLEAFYNRGSELFDQQKYEEAVIYYSEALGLDRGHINSLFNRGMCYFHLGRYNKAALDFEEVLNLDASDLEALELFAHSMYYTGNYIRALEAYNLVILKEPSPDLYINRGFSKINLNQYKTALNDFLLALEESPSENALLGAGDALFNLKDYSGAIERYTQVLALNPHNIRALNNRANAQGLSGRKELALSDYNQAILLFPNSITFTNRGAFWLREGKYEEAETDCLKALRMEGEHALAYHCMGLIMLHKKDYGSSIEFFDYAIEAGNKGSDTYNSRGVARLMEGYTEDAILDFNRAIGVDPEHAETYSNRGAAKYKLKDYSGAIADLQKAIALDADNTLAYRRLETCYMALENEKKPDFQSKGGRSYSSDKYLEWDKYELNERFKPLYFKQD